MRSQRDIRATLDTLNGTLASPPRRMTKAGMLQMQAVADTLHWVLGDTSDMNVVAIFVPDAAAQR